MFKSKRTRQLEEALNYNAQVRAKINERLFKCINDNTQLEKESMRLKEANERLIRQIANMKEINNTLAKRIITLDRHGEWLQPMFNHEYISQPPAVLCSECNHWSNYVYLFCPQCGAKMDKCDEYV